MKYFGTDGFRGRVGESLTMEHAVKIGQYIGMYFSKAKNSARIVIGKDTRRSSYMLEYAIAAGITSAGADAYLMHVTTTPSVSFITRRDNFDCGVMITASHNPYYDNGIKLIDSDGDKMNDVFLEDVEKYIDGEIGGYISSEPGKCIDYICGRNSYINYLSEVPNVSFRGYKVGLDCANGAAFSIAQTIFRMLGADVFAINIHPDGRNINVNCGSTHPEQLQKYVKENHLDIGFAFDGDADRCMMVNDKGELIDGDGILYILGLYLSDNKKLRNNTVVATIMSNIGLKKH